MKKHKKIIILICVALAITTSASAIGVTTSVFVPRNGQWSYPISPLSFRDIGVTFGKYVGLSGSFSLYGIDGMGITDADGTPLDMTGVAAGPFYSFVLSAMVKAVIPISIVTLEPAGGLFGYHLMKPQLRSGSIDSYIAGVSGYETVDSSFSMMQGKWGWGYVFGGTLTVKVADKIGVQAGALYYMGSSALNLTGTYKADGLSTENAVPTYLESARLDYTGIEFIIGVTYEM